MLGVTRVGWWGDGREKEARYHELGEQNEQEEGYGQESATELGLDEVL